MKLSIESAPHIPRPISVQKVMGLVMLALIPAILAHWWFFGPGILVQILLAVIFALAFEAAMLKARKVPVKPYLTDLSAALTGLLFALCVPPLAPWWIALLGMFFAIVVAKQLYGGIGNNIFNPAMLGFAVMLIAFPKEMSNWLAPRDIAIEVPGLWESVQYIFSGALSHSQAAYDTLTQATPLDAIKNGLRQGLAQSEIRSQPIFGDFGGMGWEWIANWYALGGLFLLKQRVITWRVPAAVILTTIAFSLPFYLYDSDVFLSPLQHLFSGGTLLGAFFIATDPVTGSSTPRGKLVFGAGVAILMVLIRQFGAFPDGVAFGVLLMNSAAPLIDRLTIPKPYGAKTPGRGGARHG